MRGSAASAVPPTGRPRPDMFDCPTARNTWRVAMTVAACDGTKPATIRAQTARPTRNLRNRRLWDWVPGAPAAAEAQAHAHRRSIEAASEEGIAAAGGDTEFGRRSLSRP